jgi:hypothetical protein
VALNEIVQEIQDLPLPFSQWHHGGVIIRKGKAKVNSAVNTPPGVDGSLADGALSFLFGLDHGAVQICRPVCSAPGASIVPDSLKRRNLGRRDVLAAVAVLAGLRALRASVRARRLTAVRLESHGGFALHPHTIEDGQAVGSSGLNTARPRLPAGLLMASLSRHARPPGRC